MTRSSARRGALLALGLGLGIVLVPRAARAEGAQEAAARALFSEGRRLVDAGNYAAACPKFEESLRLDPGAGTSFNLADCFEHLGKTASAWARFLDVAAATKAAGQTEREQVARLRAERLEPTLARLVVEVKVAEPELVVKRDGAVVGAASWGVPVPVDPGDHALEATAPGKRVWSHTATVAEGPTTLAVEVPALEALPPPEVAPAAVAAPLIPAPRAAAESPPNERSVLPVVALGALGAAAAATSVIFFLNMSSKNQEAEGLCPANNCRTADEKTEHDDLVDEARRNRTVGYVSAGVAGAALLTAAVLWWQPFRSSAPARAAARLEVRPSFGPLAAKLEVVW